MNHKYKVGDMVTACIYYKNPENPKKRDFGEFGPLAGLHVEYIC